MIIKFQDSNGLDILGGVIAIGTANNVVLGLVVDGEAETQPVAGNILRNNSKIGDFTWTTENGAAINWYAGEGRPIYVSNNDQIKAVQTLPVASTTTVTINRIQPDVVKAVMLGDFCNRVKPLIAGATNKTVLRDVTTLISQETAFSYTKSMSTNVRQIKDYLNGKGELPPQNSLIYGTTAELNNALATITPPTPIDVFNTWARFSANAYYPEGSVIPDESEAKAWYWDDAIQGAVMPLNSTTFLGFVSPELVDYYDHDVTVTSTSPDDDWNGLILCFKNEGGVNYSLSVTASCDGTNGANPDIAANLGIRYNFSTIIQTNPGDRVNSGWNNKTKRLKVRRRGDFFTILSSKWNETNFDPTLTMTLDLNSDPRFAIFKGPMQYGYCNISQPGSTFKDIKYFGGMLRDTIVDATTNEVYRYTVSNGWQKLNGVTAQDVYSAPRRLYGPDNDSYYLEIDGDITF